jgi:hypothetical protein
MSTFSYLKQVEQWNIQEIVVGGYSDGNPFTDYQIRGSFKSEHESVNVDGFYAILYRRI